MITHVNNVINNILLIILFSAHITQIKGQIEQNQSPCPDIFQYAFDGTEWFGIIESPYTNNVINIKVSFSVAANLLTNYVGVLELLGTKEDAVQRLLKGKHIRYRVRFPIQSPLPRLTAIQYNNQVICSGPQGGYTTIINLEHTLQANIPSNLYVNQNVDESDNLSYFIQSHNLSPMHIQQQVPQQQPEPIYQPQPQQQTQPLYQPQSQQEAQPVYQPQTLQQPQPQPIYQYQTEAPSTTPQTLAAPQSHNFNAHASEVQCGTIDNQFKKTALIVGGKGTRRGTWPWITALFSNKESSIQFICGGSLISQRTVITAAHCLKPEGSSFKESEIIVFVGRHDIRKWGEEGAEAADPKKLLVHPEYSKGRDFEADIGIIILAEKIKYNVYIRPVCLWPEGFNDVGEVVGKSGTVVGWGRDENGNRITSEPKQTQMPIVDELTCLRSDKGFQDLTSNRTFCAGNRDRTGPCNGDSGSGLVIYQNNRWMLRGIVSIAQSNYLSMCNLDLYIVFTDVAKFIPWIKSNME